MCPARRGKPLSPETRAKISAAMILTPPEEEVAEIIRLYAIMGTRAVAARVGYDRKVVRRVLRTAGVQIRTPGGPRVPHG
jgi:ABC-type phosphate/phosphonate transport system substrate-binding protein